MRFHRPRRFSGALLYQSLVDFFAYILHTFSLPPRTKGHTALASVTTTNTSSHHLVPQTVSNMQQPTQQTEHKCSKKKQCNNEALVCAGKDCLKTICRKCYEGVLDRNKISRDDALPGELVACTLTCHKKIMKASSNPQILDKDAEMGERLPWDCDTRNKAYLGSSEAYYLLDWLKTPGYYAQWRGNPQGNTKKAIQHTIADRLNKDGMEKEGGVIRGRDEKKVGNKIQAIEIKFQATLSFMEQTGQGIRERKVCQKTNSRIWFPVSFVTFGIYTTS